MQSLIGTPAIQTDVRSDSQRERQQRVRNDAERERRMMMQYLKQMGMAVALIVGLSLSATASAANIGDCTVTGYTFMGDTMAVYSSTPAGPNAKDYFLATSLTGGGFGPSMWGLAWAKFENLSVTPVTSAYLMLDLQGVGMMSAAPASPSNPCDLTVYVSPSDAATLGDEAPPSATRAAAKDTLLGDTIGMYTVASLPSITANGTLAIDITNLYNGWVMGMPNKGLIFASEAGARLASFGHQTGAAPYISTVPEPAAMALLGCGALAMIRRRRA